MSKNRTFAKAQSRKGGWMTYATFPGRFAVSRCLGAARQEVTGERPEFDRVD